MRRLSYDTFTSDNTCKSAKDSSTAPLPMALTENTIKFKRHFDIVCKRLLKKSLS